MSTPKILSDVRPVRRKSERRLYPLALTLAALQAFLTLPAVGGEDWPRNQVPTYQERQAFAAQMERYEADKAHRDRNRKAAAGERVAPSALKQWFFEGYTNGTIHTPQGPDFVPVAPPAKAARRAPTRKINRPLERPPGQVIRRIGK